MNKSLLSLIIITSLFLSCKQKQDPFHIGKHHIGLLTDSTQVKDLEYIYKNDSLVKYKSGDEFMGDVNEIIIFEKGGKKLLTLSPSPFSDSTAVIKNIQIIDPRYKTNKNISTLSTFKDIVDNYKVSKTINLINAVVVSVKDINASFIIDKKELPANLRFDMNLKIEPTHIPNNAKIKYFFINWSNIQ